MLEDKKILITGGTRGIGLATAKTLASYGANVTITGRSNEHETPFDYISVDFLDESSVTQFVERIEIEDFYGIVNNAGINDIHLIDEFPQQSFNEIFDVNFTSVYRILQAAARSFKQRGCDGRIVNIGSIWASSTKAGRSAYCAAKAGVTGMTRSVATDLAPAGILVNTLSPGFIQTELTEKTMGPDGILEVSQQIPLGRLGKPEEIAETVAFLISPKNTYLTGQNIIVDGGFTNV